MFVFILGAIIGYGAACVAIILDDYNEYKNGK